MGDGGDSGSAGLNGVFRSGGGGGSGGCIVVFGFGFLYSSDQGGGGGKGDRDCRGGTGGGGPWFIVEIDGCGDVRWCGGGRVGCWRLLCSWSRSMY